MIIEIDDNLPGEEKRRQIIIKQVEYAFAKFPKKMDAASFLGYSPRVMRDWVNRYPELNKYKIDYDHDDVIYMRRIYKKELWRTKKL